MVSSLTYKEEQGAESDIICITDTLYTHTHARTHACTHTHTHTHTHTSEIKIPSGYNTVFHMEVVLVNFDKITLYVMFVVVMFVSTTDHDHHKHYI